MKVLLQKLASDTRSILGLTVGVILVYLAILIPVDRKVASLDRPLELAWEGLRMSIHTNRLGGALDLNAMNEIATDMESSFSKFTDAEAELISRILLEETDQSKLTQPFQLVEYENALVTLEEQLKKESAAKKVAMDPGIYPGLPRHVVSLSEPNWLWADLAFARFILSLAIECQPDKITAFETLQGSTLEDEGMEEDHRLHRSKFRLRFESDMDIAQTFLRALPLRGSEAQPDGLPAPYWNKPSLFADGILLRKAAAQQGDKVDLQLVIDGFIYHKTLTEEASEQ